MSTWTWNEVPHFWSPSRLQAAPLTALQATVSQGEDGSMYYVNESEAEPIPGQAFERNTPVSALAGENYSADVFAIGPTSLCLTSHRAGPPGTGWDGWQPTQTGVFDQGTPIAAVRSRPTWTDLFAVGLNGQIWTSWAHPPQPFHEWVQILDEVFEPGAPVTAVSSRPGQIDLFCVNAAGQMMTALFIESAGHWQGWSPVLDGTFTPSTPVRAITVAEGAIDLFAVGTDGRVFTAGFHPPSSWQGWNAVREGTFTQRTPVACVATNQVHLLAVGMDGVPYMNSASWPSLEFDGWQNITGSPGTFAQLTELAGWAEDAAGAPGGETLGFTESCRMATPSLPTHACPDGGPKVLKAARCRLPLKAHRDTSSAVPGYSATYVPRVGTVSARPCSRSQAMARRTVDLPSSNSSMKSASLGRREPRGYSRDSIRPATIAAS